MLCKEIDIDGKFCPFVFYYNYFELTNKIETIRITEHQEHISAKFYFNCCIDFVTKRTTEVVYPTSDRADDPDEALFDCVSKECIEMIGRKSLPTYLLPLLDDDIIAKQRRIIVKLLSVCEHYMDLFKLSEKN